jgi:hypothetical protein
MALASPHSPADDGRSVLARLLVHAFAVGALLIGTNACVSPKAVTLEFTRPLDLNPRIRLDRNPLDNDQANGPEFSGPYRDGFNSISPQCMPGRDPGADNGGCEVISPITPSMQAPQLENLLQSNCLWLGDAATSSATTDVVRVNWEMVAHVRREPMHLTCNSPTDIGLCRLREPGTAREIEFQDLDKPFVACSAPEPPVNSTLDVAFGTIANLPITIEGGPLVIDTDLHIASMPLVAEYVEAATPDPYRRCPGSVGSPQAFSGGTLRPASLSGGLGCGAGGSAGNPTVDTCARDCLAFAPPGDVALRLRDTTSGATQWLRPNLMTIRGTQAIARTMIAVAGDATLRRWKVPVSPDPPSQVPASQVRWHENFSNTLQIEQVRVFVPGPNPATATDDTAPSLDPAMQSLVINGTYFISPSNADPFTITCTGTSNAATHGWVYALTRANCTGNQLDDFLLGATPAYTHQMLTKAYLPLTEPLHWDVRLAGNSATPVMIEFQIRALKQGSALLASPAVSNFGELVIGRNRDQFVAFENIGDTPLQITNASLGGQSPGDFSYRLIASRVPLPLPISITSTPHKRVIDQIEGSGSVSLDMAATATVGEAFTRLVRPNRDGQKPRIFGNDLVYVGGTALYRETPRPVPFTFPPGSIPLSTLDAYVEARLPMILDPGRSLQVLVKSQPAHYGVRSAQLKLDAYSPIDGQTRSASVVLQADAKTGGLPFLHPGYAPITTGKAGGDRMLLLENSGDRDVLRGDIRLADGRSFSVVQGKPQQVLAPGESELIRVHFAPICPANGTPNPVADQVVVETDWGTLQSGLSGYVDCSR